MKSPACCPCPADAGPTSTHHRQAGVALITVLLIVFLATIAATNLAAMQQLAIRRSTVLQHQQQARLYTLGAEQWATVILARDRQQNATDHPGEDWANLPLSLPVEGGVLSGRIRDLQGCFNLNNLWQPAPNERQAPTSQKRPDAPQQEQDDADADADTDETDTPSRPPPTKPKPPTSTGSTSSDSGKAGLNQAQLKMLQRLLTGLDLKPELAQAIADWIDPDLDTLFPDGAEDSDYTVLNPPYLAANRPFVSVSELRQVKGVDREVYDKLAPVVCALPPGTPLNVNTAPAPVLAALGEGLKPADVAGLLESRPAKGYDNVDEFLNAAKMTVDAPTKALLGVDSQYFSLRAEARVGDGRAMLYSTFYRDENGVRVLRRGFGHQD